MPYYLAEFKQYYNTIATATPFYVNLVLSCPIDRHRRSCCVTLQGVLIDNNARAISSRIRNRYPREVVDN